jgi:xylitol oxidase
MERLRELVAVNRRVKVIGTRHSFNGIADTDAAHISLARLNRVIALDRETNRVTVEGGITYGDLSRYLHEQGYALHNLASLPHITVAGACATATHGSGDGNGSLATAVYGIELLKGDGELVQLTKDDSDGKFSGAVVGLGALGVVTKLTLDVVPSYEMTQHVFEGLSFGKLADGFDDIVSSGYSVSLFTDWKEPSFNQVWLKRELTAAGGLSKEDSQSYFGAAASYVKLHPVPGVSAENCSDQLGIAGPWHERLPHFRMDFTPSAGEELQSEYFVPRKHAYDMMKALSGLSARIAPLLFISELRTVKADELWMSPCYGQDVVALHFTWKPDWEAVRLVLPLIEEKLEPFGARPHWSKLFTMAPSKLQTLYAMLPAFRELAREYDPHGKFRNTYLDTYIY